MLEHDLEYRRQVALRFVGAFAGKQTALHSLRILLSRLVIPDDSSSATQGNWQELQHDIHNA
jgi:hypothetical protein